MKNWTKAGPKKSLSDLFGHSLFMFIYTIGTVYVSVDAVPKQKNISLQLGLMLQIAVDPIDYQRQKVIFHNCYKKPYSEY